MPKYIICRTYATRMRWTVEASNKRKALAMLDDNEATPWEAGNEEWLGPAMPLSVQDLDDNCIRLPKDEVKDADE